MQNIEIAVYIGISRALVFDFVKGFHDSANAIATVVGTRGLRPLYAVGMGALANFAGPFIFGDGGSGYSWKRNNSAVLFDSRCYICRANWRHHMGSNNMVFWSPII